MTEKPFMHIFYPERIEPAEAQARPRPLPAAILVPDAAYDWVKEEIRGPYERMSASNPALTIVLSPLHQHVRKESGATFAFIPEDETFGKLPLYSTATIPAWMGKDDAYFHEEPAPEEQGSVIEAFFPHAAILPILVKPDLSSKDCQQLSSFLDRLLEAEPRTLVVSCLNGNGLSTSQTANKDFITLCGLLEAGTPLLGALHSRQISSLGTGILEEIGRCRRLPGNWHLTGFSLRDSHFTKLPDSLPEEEGRYVWHISGFKGN